MKQSNNQVLAITLLLLVCSFGVNVYGYLTFKKCHQKESSSTPISKPVYTDQIEMPSYKLRNPLVVLVGCVDYTPVENSPYSSLPGTKKALADMRDLYENTYGYEVMSSYDAKDPSTGFMKKKQILDFFKSIQDLLKKNPDNYDGLIVVLSGHGRESTFVTSELKQIRITKITDMFTLDQLPSLVNKPKLFFLDCCQGQSKDEGIDINGELHNVYEDFVVIYPTVPGYQVADEADKGKPSHFIHQYTDFVKNVPDIRDADLVSQFQVASNNVRSSSKGSECPAAKLQTGRQIYFIKKK